MLNIAINLDWGDVVSNFPADCSVKIVIRARARRLMAGIAEEGETLIESGLGWPAPARIGLSPGPVTSSHPGKAGLARDCDLHVIIITVSQYHTSPQTILSNIFGKAG